MRKNLLIPIGPTLLIASLLCTVNFQALLAVSFPSSPTAADVLQAHTDFLAQNSAEMESASLTPTGINPYFASIYLMGMLSAVEARITFDTAGADSEFQQAMHYMDNMISGAIVNVVTDTKGAQQSRRVWGPLSSGDPNELYNYQGAQCIARAAALIVKYPTLRSKYLAKATPYASFADEIAIKRWWVDSYNGQVEWLTSDPPSWNDGSQWNDKSWILGDIASSLYQANLLPEMQTTYKTIVDKIAAGFRAKLQQNGTGWIWDNGVIPIGSDDNGEGCCGNQAGVPDTDHAQRAPLMMNFMYEGGLGGWTLADVQRLGNTLGDIMWNQSSDALIANYINGSNKSYRTHFAAGENGFIFAGWALVGQYSPKALQATLAVLRGVVIGSYYGHENPTTNENHYGYYKPVGLSGHALRALILSGSQPPPPPPPPPSGNPVPNLVSISPAVITTGGAATVVTLLGQNFMNGSTVQWKGQDPSSTYVSSSKLTVTLTAADLAVPATLSIRVSNPAPGGGSSGAVTLTVTSQPIQNGVPKIFSLGPNTTASGGAAFSLTINGTQFITGSVVRWDGSDRPTHLISPDQLQADIASSDIASAGNSSVTVFNPAPGGGLSNSLTFAHPKNAAPLAVVNSLNVPPVIPIDATIRADTRNAVKITWKFTARDQSLLKSLASRTLGIDSAAGSSVISTILPFLQLQPLELQTGAYRLEVTAENSDGVASAPARAEVTLVAPDLAGVRVFPNPWRTDKHSAAPQVTFEHLSSESTVTIFTLSGHKVKTLSTNASAANWDLTNDSVDRVGSGLYVYSVTNPLGQKITGKLAIIR